VPDFQIRKRLLYLYDIFNYLYKIVSVKKNPKDLFSFFFNEIFKMVKRNVEKPQAGFTVLFIEYG